jgi:glycosyltransferase involved in cell wall biosynthesis
MSIDGSRTSFVIATRDRADELEQTLKRLLETSRSPIVVVDNASRDRTAELVESMARSHPDGERLKLVSLRRNRGAAARNHGVAACDTPYAAFCDDDSWWEPAATEIAERLFDAHAGVALLAAQTTVWPSGRRDKFSDELAMSPLGRKPGLPGPSILGFQSCSAIIRTSAFLAVGGFNPLLHIYGEEQLLAFDLAAAGWELCYCAELLACHQPSKIRNTSAARRARELRNGFLTCCMRRPADRCISALGELLRAAAQDYAYAKAAAEAFVRLPSALTRRRRLPQDVESLVRLLESQR